MEFTSSYIHAFGDPGYAAFFSGGDGGSAQALRPSPPASAAAGAKAPSVFCVQDAEVEEAPHFLDECSLCHKFLSGDIFMYRGDTPFCSEECRREQIEMDRAKHRRKKQHSPTAQAQPAAAVAAAHVERAPRRQLQTN